MLFTDVPAYAENTFYYQLQLGTGQSFCQRYIKSRGYAFYNNLQGLQVSVLNIDHRVKIWVPMAKRVEQDKHGDDGFW